MVSQWLFWWWRVGETEVFSSQIALADAGLTEMQRTSFLQDFSGPLAHAHLGCFSETCCDTQHLPNAFGHGTLPLPTELLEPE